MPTTENQKLAKISRKDQIETIATALFKERGFKATSMRDLAREVGIEAGSIYAHVRSKEEILQRVLFKMAHEYFAELEQIENQPASYSQKLRKIILAHVNIVTRNVAASTVFQNEWRHLSEPYLADFIELREKYEYRLRTIIGNGIEINEFSFTDARFITRTLLSSLNGIAQWYQLDGKLKPQEIANHVADLFLNGLINHQQERPKYH
jgi:TetR/AcrR family transcriptional regulator, cholesterol catabolism regulator